MKIELDGTSLSAAALVRLSEGAHSGVKLALSADARLRVSRSRAVVDDIVEQNEVAYGINTGFGLFGN